MAVQGTYGRGQMLGSTVDPRMFVQDYSGFANAGAIQGQGLANLGGQIAQGIAKYGEMKQERKKLESSVKASRAGIESAIKLGESLGIDIKSSLEPILQGMDNPNTSLIDAAALGDMGSKQISNAITLGIGAQDRLIQRQNAQADAAYKQAKLGLEGQRTAASVFAASQAGKPKYEQKSFEVVNPDTKQTWKIDLPFNPSTGRFFDPSAGKEILNVQDWSQGKQSYVEDEAMPTPTSQVGGGNGIFNVSYKTRDLLGKSTPQNRQVSLDFNAASNRSARGIEIIIPNDATADERLAAQNYVTKTQQFFAERGVDVPIRGVKTAKENGRGTPGRFHTEPFFIADVASRKAIESDPDAFAQVMVTTLGDIPNVTFIPPHKTNDPGASEGGLNERDFAKSVLIPALERARVGGPQAMAGDMSQQAMGTPQQQAAIAEMIANNQGLATAQNFPQVAVSTDPSQLDQPAIPQQATTQQQEMSETDRIMMQRGFRPKSKVKWRRFTPEEAKTYGSQGQVNEETGEAKPIRPPSGMTIEQTPDGGFRFVQGSGVGSTAKQQRAEEASRKQSGQQFRAIAEATESVLPLIERASENPLGSRLETVTGDLLPASQAGRLAAGIETINTQNSLATVNELRNSSVTGGIGGNITEKEWPRFENRVGKIQAGMNPADLKKNVQLSALNQFEAVNGEPKDVIKLLEEKKIDQTQFNEYVEAYDSIRLSSKIPMDGIGGQSSAWTKYNTDLKKLYKGRGVASGQTSQPTTMESIQELRSRLNKY